MLRRSFIRACVGALSIAAVTVLSACENPFSNDGDTRIRLRNATGFELTAVTFAPGAPRLEFARIAVGETTAYTVVDHAYRYGYLDALIGGEHRRLQPIDYVGESYIGGGRFTYVITVDAPSRNPIVTLVED